MTEREPQPAERAELEFELERKQDSRPEAELPSALSELQQGGEEPETMYQNKSTNVYSQFYNKKCQPSNFMNVIKSLVKI